MLFSRQCKSKGYCCYCDFLMLERLPPIMLRRKKALCKLKLLPFLQSGDEPWFWVDSAVLPHGSVGCPNPQDECSGLQVGRQGKARKGTRKALSLQKPVKIRIQHICSIINLWKGPLLLDYSLAIIFLKNITFWQSKWNVATCFHIWQRLASITDKNECLKLYFSYSFSSFV